MAGLKFVCLAVVSMVLFSSAVDADITCGLVVQSLVPCVSYARSGAGPVPGACCNGIQRLNNAAKTTRDRQDACKCMEQAAASFTGLNYGVIASIPRECGVSIPYTLSPTTDCSK